MWSYKDHGKSWEAVYEREHAPGFRWLHRKFRYEFPDDGGPGCHRSYPATPDGRLACPPACRMRSASGRKPGIYLGYEYRSFLKVSNTLLISATYSWIRRVWLRGGRVIVYCPKSSPAVCRAFPGSCSEIYLEKAFDSTGWRPEVRLPNAVTLGEDSLMFLVHPTLSRERDSEDTRCAGGSHAGGLPGFSGRGGEYRVITDAAGSGAHSALLRLSCCGGYLLLRHSGSKTNALDRKSVERKLYMG